MRLKPKIKTETHEEKRERVISLWDSVYQRALDGDIDRDALMAHMQMLLNIDYEKHERELRDHIIRLEHKDKPVDTRREQMKKANEEYITRKLKK